MNLTRRELLTKTALGTAGLALGGLAFNQTAKATAKKTIAQIAEADVVAFIKTLKGPAVRPTDAAYEVVHRVWNGKFQQKPGLVVQCSGPEDVARTIEFAAKHDLVMAVRSGKHSLAGKSTNNGGLVLDMSTLVKVEVNPVKKTARAEAGVLLGEFDIATEKHGLATTAGTEISTGVAGLTLGGGLGYLMGKHGLTCDNLLSVRMVLADGRLVTASEKENPDLFWAVRGAGANFGVTTSFEYQLHPMPKEILSGEIKCPHESLGDLLKLYREFNSTIPDDVGITASLVPQADGKPLAAFTVGFFGTVKDDPTKCDFVAGEKALEVIRAFCKAKGGKDTIEKRSYLWIQQLWKMKKDWMPRAVVRSNFLKELDDDTIKVMVAHSAKAPPGTGKFVMEFVHGAATRVRADAMAYPHRFAGYPCSLHADCDTVEQEKAAEAWATDFWKDMKSLLRPAVYSNYLADEGDERARASYGENYKRLAELKKKYDPTNFFNLNQNVRPAT